MSGVKLGELDMADMVDVLHYMFEEDMRFTSAEQAEAVSKSRSMLYREMYSRDYAYKFSSGIGAAAASIDPPLGEDIPSDVRPIDVARQAAMTATKPYVPPTHFDGDSARPFGTTLDAPLN
jgi:hypothetical protein